MARADGDAGADRLSAKPNFEGVFGQTTNPLRLVFMMGVVWKLAQDHASDMLKVLEIGSWAGASALTWGEAIQLYFSGHGHITCVDRWEPYVDLAANPDELNRAMNEALVDRQPYDVFLANMKFLPHGVGLDVRKGQSQEILPSLEREAFDLVYIDGDHAYAAVAADIAHAIDLVRPGGILCGDDLELQAHACDVSIVDRQPAVERCQDGRSGVTFHPGVTKAVGEKFGPVSSWSGFWAVRKTMAGWRNISLAGMPARIPGHIPAPSLIGLKAVLMKDGVL